MLNLLVLTVLFHSLLMHCLLVHNLLDLELARELADLDLLRALGLAVDAHYLCREHFELARADSEESKNQKLIDKARVNLGIA